MSFLNRLYLEVHRILEVAGFRVIHEESFMACFSRLAVAIKGADQAGTEG